MCIYTFKYMYVCIYLYTYIKLRNHCSTNRARNIHNYFLFRNGATNLIFTCLLVSNLTLTQKSSQ